MSLVGGVAGISLFRIGKLLLGLSLVSNKVPAPTVKLLEFPDWSVTELLSFKIKKPFVPYVTEGVVFIFHSPVLLSKEPNVVGPYFVPSIKWTCEIYYLL